MTDRHERDTGGRRFSVLIAGGGVAGLEAAFALRELAGDHVAVTMLSADEDFIYRPLSIGEPFNNSHAEHFDLAALATEAGAELVHGTVTDVDPAARLVRTAEGSELAFDALLVATGARIEPFSEHAINVDDAHMDELLHGLVQDIEGGYAHRLAIVIPAPMPWPLPGYELALMASERAWDMQTKLEIVLLTPERTAVEVFGEQVSREVAALLAERHIELVTSAYCEIPRPRQVVVHPGGRVVHATRVIALPRLLGPALRGLPTDGSGFVPVDEYGRVPGVDRVWAAGDATDVAIKQGGVAAQLADVAARSIAERAGAPVQPHPFAPRIEGVLMTGGAPRYLRADPAFPGPAGKSAFTRVPGAMAPPKITAPYLAPHLRRGTSAVIAGKRRMADAPGASSMC
jgi:sulfide:quinone oxidoreductase